MNEATIGGLVGLSRYRREASAPNQAGVRRRDRRRRLGLDKRRAISHLVGSASNDRQRPDGRRAEGDRASFLLEMAACHRVWPRGEKPLVLRELVSGTLQVREPCGARGFLAR